MGADVAVVGAGIVGLATAVALLDAGAAVTVYERGVPGAAQSGGEARIFRHAHEDERLVRLAVEARGRWRAWEERFGVELLRADGVLSLGPAAPARLAVLERAGGVRARMVGAADVAERLPVLAASGPALLDEDGGVLRTRAAVGALAGAVGDRMVVDEVLAVRSTPAGTAEVRTGGATTEHARVVVCAGRGTPALAAGTGLELGVGHAAHARLTFAVRGAAPVRLGCLLDGSGAFGAPGAYGDPLPGNDRYAIGLHDVAARADGAVEDPGALAAAAAATCDYVARALPGLDPRPVEVRHCWVTSLPWGHDAVAAWDAGPLTFVAGGNLFKHAPALGAALAGAALGDGVPAWLAPAARLGTAAT